MIRNIYYKNDTPENTIAKIKEGLSYLKLEVQENPINKISDSIFWSSLTCKSLGLKVTGKGTSELMCIASAYAELAERFSYPKQREYIRNAISLSEEDKKLVTYKWLNSYSRSSNSFIRFKAYNDSVAKNYWVDSYIGDAVPLMFIDHVSATNGLASGNTIEEAIIQASCEIFERYVFFNVIQNETELPTISLDSINNEIRNMMQFYMKNNIDIKIKDLSMNKEFPVIGVLYTNKSLPKDSIIYRRLVVGSAFNMEEALKRCFTEMMQGHLNTENIYYRDIKINQEIDILLLLKKGICTKSLEFLDSGKTVSFNNSFSYLNTLEKELIQIIDICKNRNTSFNVINLTHPILSFPVVRVIIPNMSNVLMYRCNEEPWFQKFFRS